MAVWNGPCTVYRLFPQPGQPDAYQRFVLPKACWQQARGYRMEGGYSPDGRIARRGWVLLPLSPDFSPQVGDLFLRGVCPIPGEEAAGKLLAAWSQENFRALYVALYDSGAPGLRHWEVEG